MKKIILASASPRRKELMKQAGLEFDVCVSTKEEKKGPWGPEEMVRRLSRQKAQDVAERYAEDCIVIGADTVVACDQDSVSLQMIRMRFECFICCRDGHMKSIQVLLLLKAVWIRERQRCLPRKQK